VQNLRQGADPDRARSQQERQGISLINTLKGRRRRSSNSVDPRVTGEQRLAVHVSRIGKDAENPRADWGPQPGRAFRFAKPPGTGDPAAGSIPAGCTEPCPPTLQEAKPKAGTIRDRKSRKRTADGSRSPEAQASIIPGSPAF
jgi:hypothetical protein